MKFEKKFLNKDVLVEELNRINLYTIQYIKKMGDKPTAVSVRATKLQSLLKRDDYSKEFFELVSLIIDEDIPYNKFKFELKNGSIVVLNTRISSIPEKIPLMYENNYLISSDNRKYEVNLTQANVQNKVMRVATSDEVKKYIDKCDMGIVEKILSILCG